MTQAPYSYAGDDPLDFADPTGLDWGWNPISDAKQAWNDTGGKVVHGVDVAAHGTVGICLGGDAAWGPGVTASGCITLSHLTHPGATVTVGGGGGTPAAGVHVGFLYSNATKPSQLGKAFGYGGGSVTVGPDIGVTAGGTGFVGEDDCNKTIYGGTAEVGLGADLPLPFEGHGGGSWTWTWG